MTTRIIIGDARQRLAELPAESVHCVVTSPPYFGLRDYGVAGQIGLEATPDAYVAELVAVFRDVRRVLRADGTLWLNLGDSYSGAGGPQPKQTKWQVDGASNSQNAGKSRSVVCGLKAKDLIGIPWSVAFALRADGWYLRQDIIWSKPNPMPESVRDRCTKAHEYLFMLSKSARYCWDSDAMQEAMATPPHAPGNQKLDVSRNDHDQMQKVWGATGTRNRRSVWTITTQPFSEAHFATFPPALVEPCIKAGCPKGGTVLDPFGGAGTVGLVADRLQRNAILIELNPEYAAMANRRIRDDAPLLQEAAE